VLLYEGNLNLLTGSTRLGLLHGVGAAVQMSFDDETAYLAGLPLVAGVFVQHSLDPLSHIYGAARYTRFVFVSSQPLNEEPNSNSLSFNVGYMKMGSEKGLQLAPELGVIYGLDEGARNLAILLGLSMSANFL
jgi:hypothetical protein